MAALLFRYECVPAVQDAVATIICGAHRVLSAKIVPLVPSFWHAFATPPPHWDGHDRPKDSHPAGPRIHLNNLDSTIFRFSFETCSIKAGIIPTLVAYNHENVEGTWKHHDSSSYGKWIRMIER